MKAKTVVLLAAMALLLPSFTAAASCGNDYCSGNYLYQHVLYNNVCYVHKQVCANGCLADGSACAPTSPPTPTPTLMPCQSTNQCQNHGNSICTSDNAGTVTYACQNGQCTPTYSFCPANTACSFTNSQCTPTCTDSSRCGQNYCSNSWVSSIFGNYGYNYYCNTENVRGASVGVCSGKEVVPCGTNKCVINQYSGQAQCNYATPTTTPVTYGRVPPGPNNYAPIFAIILILVLIIAYYGTHEGGSSPKRKR